MPDPDLTNVVVAAAPPAESGKPDRQDINAEPTSSEDQDIDPKYWLRCLEDGERAESDWRKRGREITQIYRNESGNNTLKNNQPAPRAKGRNGRVTFNILYANTEVMLPAIYTKPPEPVVRARFTQPDPPPAPPMPPMAMPPPGMGAPPGPPPAGPVLPGTLGPPSLPPVAAAAPPPNGTPALAPIGPGAGAPGPGGGLPPLLASAGPPPNMPGKPKQRDIDTAASIIEKALEIVVEDELSHESVKAAIKDVLLPGRGVVRVRWIPTMEQRPVMAGDGTTPLPAPPQMGDNGGPPMEDVKVWEQVNDEYVYWEDILFDPVRAPGDTDWLAFRHLFTAKQAIDEFKGKSPKFDQLLASGQMESKLCLWTEESAAKDLVGGGTPMKAAGKLGDVIKKMMAWEIWDRVNCRIIWFVREVGGMVLRVDEDSYGLEGFYPVPRPMLAVTTTDSQIPRAFYDLYADLAADLDETSRRISNLTKQVKVRGAYNSASSDIAALLTADDNKMIPVDGVDMINGGLANHIWLVPVVEFMNALDKLYVAREQIKQAIYEIMGISDLMRGATKASETATAQRIKGSMGMVRLSDQKQQAANFVTDLLKMKAELIAKNFAPETLSAMTGEDVTPEVLAILRSDFMRTCTVSIEADSTVVADMQEEQQSMQQMMAGLQGVFSGIAQLAMTQIWPADKVTRLGIELLKIQFHSVRYSRGIIELLNDFSDELQQQQAMKALMPPQPPPPQPPPGAGAPSAGPGGPHPASPHPGPPAINGKGPLPPPAPGMPPTHLQ